MKSSKILLFDLGGVLVEITGFDTLNTLLTEPLDSLSIRERWLHSPAVQLFEIGKLTPEAFADQFIKEWGIPHTPHEFILEFKSWVSTIHTDAEALMYKLRHTYHVSCLSNTNELHFASLQLDQFSKSFDSTFFSHLIGHSKPDEKIFKIVIKQLNAKPNHIYYFDDTPSNIQAAKQLGINAFLVDGFEDLQRSLRSKNFI
jgi:putative hydrolase of the HAD superfamily